MRINHNIAALNTYNKLTANTAATSKSLEKLSSGLKINKAGDNAAGLAISEKMRGQIRGLDQASTNASDAISLINTAEGALSETHSILQRMRELAVQSSNDTNVTVDREEIQKEMNQLTSEINRIGNTTEFNTQKLLNGDKKVIADTAAKVVGNTALGASVDIRANKIYNTATSTGITYTPAASDIGATATGTKTLSGGTATALTQNELTLTVSGFQQTIVVASGLNLASGTLISGLNTALSGAFGAGKVTASLVDNKLKLTVDGGALADISIDGGGMAKLLFGDDLTTVNYTNGVNSGSNYLGIHTATKATATGSGVVNTGKGTDGDHNELTLTVNGSQKTIAVASGLSGADLLSGLNTQLSGAFGAGKVTASFTAAGKLELTTASGGATQSISIDGGNMASTFFGTTTAVAGQDANNTLSFKVGGLSGTQTLTIDSNNYTSASGLAGALQEAIDGVSGLGAQIQASVISGKVVLSSKAVGTTITDFGGTAAASLGFTNPTFGSGLLENNSFTIAVDGGTAKTISLSGSNYSNSGLVNALQTKIDAEIGTGKAKVSLVSGKLAINTVSAEGSGSTIAITGATEFLKAVGFGSVSGVDDAGEEGKGTSLAFQIGANTAQSMSIQIEDMRSVALKISSSGGGTVVSKDGKATASYVSTANVNNGTTDTLNEYALDVSTHEKATAAITILDDAIASVSAERSKLGSYQNRLEHTINNLGTSSENLTSAESRIRDVDMAKEMMEFTKNNILSQAAQSMLAQANQQPQGVLQLLQ